MGDDRHDARGHQLEHDVFEARRGDVVRRLQQQVARAGQRWHAAVADARDQFRIEVHIGALDQPQRDAALVQFGLEGGDRRADAAAVLSYMPG